MFTKKGDAAVLAKLGDAPAQYREIGERLHRIIRESAPSLEPIVRWGLPFYVKNGKDICYIKPDKDFIAFGFGEDVNPAREEGVQVEIGRQHPQRQLHGFAQHDARRAQCLEHGQKQP
jgi:hypothetical protein